MKKLYVIFASSALAMTMRINKTQQESLIFRDKAKFGIYFSLIVCLFEWINLEHNWCECVKSVLVCKDGFQWMISRVSLVCYVLKLLNCTFSLLLLVYIQFHSIDLWFYLFFSNCTSEWFVIVIKSRYELILIKRTIFSFVFIQIFF